MISSSDYDERIPRMQKLTEIFSRNINACKRAASLLQGICRGREKRTLPTASNLIEMDEDEFKRAVEAIDRDAEVLI